MESIPGFLWPWRLKCLVPPFFGGKIHGRFLQVRTTRRVATAHRFFLHCAGMIPGARLSMLSCCGFKIEVLKKKQLLTTFKVQKTYELNGIFETATIFCRD